LTSKPKKLRFRNSKATAEARKRDGICLYGWALAVKNNDPCSPGLDGHHIETRGSGGDDVPENIITLCRKHHDNAPNVDPKVFQSILANLYGYEYEGVEPWRF
jgi:hypothetical protein